jgi:glycosyltransferase involved in cell wall biosynthesis
MKIALFGTVVGFGGIQTHTRLLAEMLRTVGCEVTVYSSVLDASSVGRGRSEDNQRLADQGVDIVFLPARESLWARLGDFVRLARALRRLQPEVLLCTGKSWHAALLGWAARRGTRRIFFEVMSGEPDGPRDPRWLVRTFFDEVIGQSPNVAKTFARRFYWRGSVSAIPALPEPLECITKLPEAVAHRVPHGKARAGFFSRLVEGKQAYWLVKHWDALKEHLAELHIHGHGPERPLIEQYIKEHRLEGRVFCHGPYPSGQAYVDLLATYDMMLLPTVFPEGAPLVLLEAMACGVPFVANGVGGVPDYGRENPDCIVTPAQDRFVAAVVQMARALDAGTVDQARVQRYYRERYSQAALSECWLGYLGIRPAAFHAARRGPAGALKPALI